MMHDTTPLSAERTNERTNERGEAGHGESTTHRKNLYWNAEISHGNNEIICPHGD